MTLSHTLGWKLGQQGSEAECSWVANAKNIIQGESHFRTMLGASMNIKKADNPSKSLWLKLQHVGDNKGQEGRVEQQKQ